MASFKKGGLTLQHSINNIRKPKLSNASQKITAFKLALPFNYRFTKLLLRLKSKSGRGSLGRITVFSKGSRQKKLVTTLNYSFRSRSLFLFAGFSTLNLSRKISSLLFSSSGQITYLPSSPGHELFFFNKFQRLWEVSPQILKDLLISAPFVGIKSVPYLLLHQPKNRKLSFIELTPLSSVKFVRSLGCSAFLIKLDTRTGLGLLKLPSGIKKVFSAFSLCSTGPAIIDFKKNILFNTKAGDFRKFGLKSKVRGVAMNPVDHPHGGRTNSIKYPRTPWGKTTKFK